MEHGDTIAFMHAVQEGAASRSYGLQVAALAGVPKPVIQRARHKLHELEANSLQHGEPTSRETTPSMPSAPEHPLIQHLRELEPDSLSPRQALDMLYRLRQLL